FTQRLIHVGQIWSLRAVTYVDVAKLWTGVARGASFRVNLDVRPANPLNLLRPSVNGISYLHVISAGEQPGPSIQLLSVAAEAR
ncbi:MAG: hypothetical protein ACK5VI_10655, partial [Opitutia bacterium]